MKAIVKKIVLNILFAMSLSFSYARPLTDTSHLQPQKNSPVPHQFVLHNTHPAKNNFKTDIKLDSAEDSLIVVNDDNSEFESSEDLARLEEDYRKSTTPKTMMRLLKKMKVKRAFRNKRYRARLYNDLAIISARLKLYPLAMQYHSQTIEFNTSDSSTDAAGGLPVTTTEEADSGSLVLLTALNADSLPTNNSAAGTAASMPITADEIIQSYEDGKTGAEFALILHVKQPSPGKRKSFTGIDNVGHMFISLIKYNTDHSYVCRSFGFYPDKNNFFAATPLHPAAPPVLKDDALHEWDEAIGKFISHKRFLKIIKLLTKYEGRIYHLNQNNCTDFGLTVASLSGITISNTKGKWPLGRGNNPANAGQSILEGKFRDEDRQAKNELFILNSIQPVTGQQQ